MHIHIYTHTHIYIYIYTHTYIYTYIQTCTYVYSYNNICVMCILHKYTYIYIYKHTTKIDRERERERERERAREREMWEAPHSSLRGCACPVATRKYTSSRSLQAFPWQAWGQKQMAIPPKPKTQTLPKQPAKPFAHEGKTRLNETIGKSLKVYMKKSATLTITLNKH